jgi:hypothetical protein
MKDAWPAGMSGLDLLTLLLVYCEKHDGDRG